MKLSNIGNTKKTRSFMIGLLLMLCFGILPVQGCGADFNTQQNAAQNAYTESQKTDIQETEITDSEAQGQTEHAGDTQTEVQTKPSTEVTLSLANIPRYSGKPFTLVNDNVPEFRDTDLSTTSYEYYSELDKLGRCGVAYA